MSNRLMRLIAIIGLALILISCRADSGAVASGSHDATMSAATSAAADSYLGLHNVLKLDGGVISGSMPEGDAGFDSLASMGVRTIISVDGATPDLARAEARGMRYVHLPIGYDGVGPADAEAIAIAMRDLPGPVYVHCHHGKHRGPAAVAVGAVCNGLMTNEEAVSFLHTAGTSPSYPGLFAAAERARAHEFANSTLVAADLPRKAEVAGFVDAMARIDRVWDRIKLIRAAGWESPADHPDLAPAAEAAMLADLFRSTQEDVHPVEDMTTFTALLADALNAASELETNLVVGDKAGAAKWYERLAATCKNCHVTFRD